MIVSGHGLSEAISLPSPKEFMLWNQIINSVNSKNITILAHRPKIVMLLACQVKV